MFFALMKPLHSIFNYLKFKYVTFLNSFVLVRFCFQNSEFAQTLLKIKIKQLFFKYYAILSELLSFARNRPLHFHSDESGDSGATSLVGSPKGWNNQLLISARENITKTLAGTLNCRPWPPYRTWVSENVYKYCEELKHHIYP